MTHFRFVLIAAIVLVGSTYIAVEYPDILENPAKILGIFDSF